VLFRSRMAKFLKSIKTAAGNAIVISTLDDIVDDILKHYNKELSALVASRESFFFRSRTE